MESGRVLNITVHGSLSTSKTVYSLRPHYYYECRIAAFNRAGTGPYARNSTQMPPDGQSFVQ